MVVETTIGRAPTGDATAAICKAIRPENRNALWTNLVESMSSPSFRHSVAG
jgi:hypothetical protein